MQEETLKERVFEVLDKNGLNWNVEKRPLSVFDDESQKHVESGFFGATRTDSKVVLGTCSDRYEVFQNSEMAEIATRVMDHTGFKLSKAQAFGNGKKIAITLQGKDRILEYPKRGDVVNTLYTLTNSHDGSASLQVKQAIKVVSCLNLEVFDHIHKGKESIRHTTNMRSMLDDTLIALEMVESQHETLFEQIERMIQKQIGASEIQEAVELVTDVDISQVPVSGESDLYSTRQVNKAKTLLDSINEEIDFKGANAWGLHSGITQFTTHKAGYDRTREESKIFGNNARIDRKSFEYATSLVEQ